MGYSETFLISTGDCTTVDEDIEYINKLLEKYEVPERAIKIEGGYVTDQLCLCCKARYGAYQAISDYVAGRKGEDNDGGWIVYSYDGDTPTVYTFEEWVNERG